MIRSKVAKKGARQSAKSVRVVSHVVAMTTALVAASVRNVRVVIAKSVVRAAIGMRIAEIVRPVVVGRVIDLQESSAVLLVTRCGRSPRHTNELGPVHLPPPRDVGITDQRRSSAGR